MTISELIEVLEKIKKRHGDIPVKYVYIESQNNDRVHFKFNSKDIKK